MDEISPLFQEIEFHERLRGYDPDEVDAYVDRVARAAAVLRGRLIELQERVDAAEARANRGGGAGIGVVNEEAETLTRTLVLAQRTADAAIAEAREEADRMTADAATSAQAIVSAAEADAQVTLREAQAEAAATIRDSEDRASLMLAEAETDRRTMLAEAEVLAAQAAAGERDRLAVEVAELQEYRAFLADDIEILERHLTEERHQLTASVAALNDLLESPDAFRSSRPPETSGVEVDVDRLEPVGRDLEAFGFGTDGADETVDPVDSVETPIVDEPAPADDAESAEVTELAEIELAEVEETLDPVVDDEPEPVGAPVFDPPFAPEADETFEESLAAAEPIEANADEADEADEAEPEEMIDLVAAEEEAAAAEADPLDAGPDDDDDGGGWSADEPVWADEPVAFAGMAESTIDAPAESPPRLMTAADLEPATSGSRLGLDDGGPATAPVPTVQETSLFSDPAADDDDPFLAQLRDAMEGEYVPETDDDALTAFFDQEDDDGGRSWFGRRR